MINNTFVVDDYDDDSTLELDWLFLRTHTHQMLNFFNIFKTRGLQPANHTINKATACFYNMRIARVME